jgi:hypothetical protein
MYVTFVVIEIHVPKIDCISLAQQQQTMCVSSPSDMQNTTPIT